MKRFIDDLVSILSKRQYFLLCIGLSICIIFAAIATISVFRWAIQEHSYAEKLELLNKAYEDMIYEPGGKEK